MRKIFIPLLVTIILVSLAIVSEKLYFTDYEYHFRTKVFNRVLAEKQAIMDQCLEDMKPILSNDDHYGSISENNIFRI